MTDNVRRRGSPTTDVVLAGVRFRSPIGLAPIGGGSHFGRQDADPEREGATSLQFLLEHVRAGSSFLYLNFSYLTEATFIKLQAATSPSERTEPPNRLLKNDVSPPERTGHAEDKDAKSANSSAIGATEDEVLRRPVRSGGRDFVFQQPSKAAGERFMRASTPVAPYGVEGLYSTVSPGPSPPNLEREESRLVSQKMLVGALKDQKPAGVPIIGGVIGCGGLSDAYVDAALRCEELGVDLIELNFHCPLQAGMRDGVENALEGRFPVFSQGGLMTEHPDAVERIVREVVKAVKTPVGAKFSAEAGFPRIVGLARLIRGAGAKYISVGGAAVGIAPPDIYNRGRPLWPFVDGNPFCLTSGSWMRRVCYRDVAAVARFVPGLDIVASGGLMTPEHRLEAMMLGATLTQLCTGVMEQGRGLLRRSSAFLRDFLTDQGYDGAQDLVGLGQPYIKYAEDVDVMAGQIVSALNEARCNRCGHCLNNLCIAIRSDHGKIVVDADKCTGCGACTIACQADAFELVSRTASNT